MAAALQRLTLKDRLEFYAVKRDECAAAIQGRSVPVALGMEVTQACVVRGILHTPGFGLELRGTLPIFTRALNARSILSNTIPDMGTPDEVPYCIWYPEVADETTYQLLAGRYPHMRYQVGRACAVAGYVDLYRSLDLLPEVSIAEEALANVSNPGAKTILDDIMASPVKYSVMNDYTRTIRLDAPVVGAHLNGDTAVRSLLDDKHVFRGGDTYTTPDARHYRPWGRRNEYFNITEDFCVTDKDDPRRGDRERSHAEREAQESKLRLLYNPLPVDLPSINKDLLILRAAYSGNIERYTRLRRPVMIPDELACVLRGIYHDTMYAKWWARELDEKVQRSHVNHRIRRAINARCIMNNDLSRITHDISEWDIPYLIYYPNFAARETYQELLRRKPAMRQQIARAYLVMDEQELWDAVDPAPDPFLYKEADDHPNRYYVEDLERRDPNRESLLRNVSDGESGKMWSLPEILQSKRRRKPMTQLWGDGVDFVVAEQGGIYDGLRADFEDLEHWVGRLDLS